MPERFQRDKGQPPAPTPFLKGYSMASEKNVLGGKAREGAGKGPSPRPGAHCCGPGGGEAGHLHAAQVQHPTDAQSGRPRGAPGAAQGLPAGPRQPGNAARGLPRRAGERGGEGECPPRPRRQARGRHLRRHPEPEPARHRGVRPPLGNSGEARGRRHPPENRPVTAHPRREVSRGRAGEDARQLHPRGGERAGEGRGGGGGSAGAWRGCARRRGAGGGQQWPQRRQGRRKTRRSSVLLL